MLCLSFWLVPAMVTDNFFEEMVAYGGLYLLACGG